MMTFLWVDKDGSSFDSRAYKNQMFNQANTNKKN